MSEFAVEATGLVKRFGGSLAVDGVDLAVPAGSIYGVLGPNGAGKTTTLRMLLGIIDPDEGERRLLGSPDPLAVADQVGYLPEERGLYQSMTAREAIAFLGALRGLSLSEGRRRATALLAEYDLPPDRAVKALSGGRSYSASSAVARRRPSDSDRPRSAFSGLDAINQEKLESLIRAQATAGATILFSTHVIAHAERLCERVAIIAGGQVRFEGTVEEARGRLAPRVALRTRAQDGPWRAALPANAERTDGCWRFDLPPDGIEPLLSALIAGEAGIETLAIERPGLHDAFVEIVGAAPEPDEEEAA